MAETSLTDFTKESPDIETTLQYDPAGAVCDGCATTATRLWDVDDGDYCDDCRSWVIDS